MRNKLGGKTLKKIIVGLIIAVVILAIVILGINMISRKNVDNKEEVKLIKVNEVTRSVFYAPQYAAISLGYFKNQGLDIELTTGQGADAVMTAVLANQCDIGFAGPEASIYVYNEGKDDYTQVFAQLTKKDGSFLVSRNDEKDFKWSNLKGKTIIPGRKGGVPRMTLEYVIKKHGMNPHTDMSLDDSISFDLMAGAFSAGNADYVALFEPTASLTELSGKGYVVSSVGSEAGDVAYTAYFAKKSYIEKNSDIIEKFTKAVYEGQKWVKSHTAREIAEKIVDFFPDTEIDLLERVIQSYINIDAWNDTPVINKAAFENLQTIMIEAGELKEKAPYEDIINNKYAEKVVK